MLQSSSRLVRRQEKVGVVAVPYQAMADANVAVSGGPIDR